MNRGRYATSRYRVGFLSSCQKCPDAAEYAKHNGQTELMQDTAAMDQGRMGSIIMAVFGALVALYEEILCGCKISS